MPAAYYIVSTVASLLISVIQFLMFFRAIMSWLPFDDDNALSRFVFGATEPFILPMRALLERIPFFRTMPIDMSFLFTFLIFSLLQSFL